MIPIRQVHQLNLKKTANKWIAGFYSYTTWEEDIVYHWECNSKISLQKWIIIVIKASSKLCWGQLHEFCFCIPIYPKPNPLDWLHFFGAIFTTLTQCPLRPSYILTKKKNEYT